MAHNVALNFEDGVTRFIPCRSDETVADASFRAGVNIPMDCRDGACGTCKCHAESGDFDAGSYIEDALTEQEFAQGYALACQIRPHSDLVISIAASSAACRIKSQNVPTTLTAVERLSDTAIAVYASGGLAVGVPARAVCQCHGARDGSASGPTPSVPRPVTRRCPSLFATFRKG